ncbi:hypothetical protein QTN25_004309 [Entamoeba marina]
MSSYIHIKVVIEVEYRIIDTTVIEMANISGLPLVPPEQDDHKKIQHVELWLTLWFLKSSKENVESSVHDTIQFERVIENNV